MSHNLYQQFPPYVQSKSTVLAFTTIAPHLVMTDLGKKSPLIFPLSLSYTERPLHISVNTLKELMVPSLQWATRSSSHDRAKLQNRSFQGRVIAQEWCCYATNTSFQKGSAQHQAKLEVANVSLYSSQIILRSPQVSWLYPKPWEQWIAFLTRTYDLWFLTEHLWNKAGKNPAGNSTLSEFLFHQLLCWPW